MHTELVRHARREAVGGAAGQILGLHAGRLRPGRVGGEVAAQRQLLQAHQACALLGRQPDPGRERVLVLAGVRVPALLHGGDAEGRPPGGRVRAGESSGPCARIRRGWGIEMTLGVIGAA